MLMIAKHCALYSDLVIWGRFGHLVFLGVFIVGLVLGPARFLLWICLQNRYARFG